jgi:hypothetical protein
MGFARRRDVPLRRNGLLDSGAPLCVIPYAVHHVHNFDWQPLPGPWPSGFTQWQGVPCIVGQIAVWAPIAEAPYFRGPYNFIAKFAQATPHHLPANLPILVGLNFLADHKAETAFRCHTIPQAGSIILP